jgi:capsular polysaccharide biosynthesis protein
MRYAVTDFDGLKNCKGTKYFDAIRPQEPAVQTGDLQVFDTKADFIEITDVILARVGIVVDGTWCADSVHYMPPDWRGAPWVGGKVGIGEPEEIELPDFHPTDYLRGEYFLIDSLNGSRNYGDFIHDTLPYGLMYRSLRQTRPGLKILMLGKFMYASQLALFEAIFGVHPNECTIWKERMQVEQLVVARRQTDFTKKEWCTSFVGLRFARDEAHRFGAGRSGGKATSGGLDVYLSRITKAFPGKMVTQEQGRSYSNLPDLELSLIAKGFFVFEPGLISIQHLISVLSMTRKVVSVHGAGLSNILFCQPGTRVFEIRSFFGNWRSLEAISAVLGHEFVPLIQPAPTDPTSPKVDIGSIVQAVYGG